VTLLATVGLVAHQPEHVQDVDADVVISGPPPCLDLSINTPLPEYRNAQCLRAGVVDVAWPASIKR